MPKKSVLELAFELDRAGQPFTLATVVRAERPTSAKPGAKAIVTADGVLTGWVGGSCARPTVIREALSALRDDEPRLVRLCPPEKLGSAPQEGVVEVALTCISGGTLEIYIEPHVPRPHLVAVGHLPVAEALARLGKDAGYEVTVMGLDITPDRFSWADRAINHLDFSQVRPDTRTYVVVASHGNYDEEALEGALNSGAEYVGLVASAKRAEAVIRYLHDTGLSDERLAQVKYPAGLDIGAVTPEEIAVSILAEIVQRHRQARPATLDPSLRSGQALARQSAEATDPVCGMTVEIATARYTASHAGQAYFFCSAGCKRSFENEPEKYATTQGATRPRPAANSQEERRHAV